MEEKNNRWVYVRPVDPSVLYLSLSLHRHHIYVFPLDLALSVVHNNKIVSIDLNRPDPIVFNLLLLPVDTSDRLYEDFILLFFLHDHRETSSLDNVLLEESDQFRFLHTTCLDNLKGSVGLIMTKESVMRISIPLDISSRTFIPRPRFILSRRSTPLLSPSLVLFPPCSV